MWKCILTGPFRLQAAPQLPEPESNRSASIFSLKFEERGSGGGICSGLFLICTVIKTCILSYQKLLKTDNRVCQTELLPESITQLFLMTLLPRIQQPQEYSFFWEYCYSEINSSCLEQNNRNNFPPWYPSSFMESVMPPGHFTFQMLQLILQRRLLQKVAEIASSIKGIIQTITKES